MSSGHRLVLIYNLVSKTRGPLPHPADHSDAFAAAKAAVRRWEEELDDGEEDAPAKLLYLLEHL